MDSSTHEIELPARLMADIESVVNYLLSDEEHDYKQWRQENPDATDEAHIVHTLKRLRATVETAVTVEVPASLASEVREALEGDSNDAEHDALVSVAQHFGIEYGREEDAYTNTNTTG